MINTKIYAEGLKKAKEKRNFACIKRTVLREGSREFLMKIYEENAICYCNSAPPRRSYEAERYGIAEFLPDERHILAECENKVEPLIQANRILG